MLDTLLSKVDFLIAFLNSSLDIVAKNLLSRDELAVLDGGKCILQLRGVRPFLSDKYDLTQHPNYKLTSDYEPPKKHLRYWKNI